MPWVPGLFAVSPICCSFRLLFLLLPSLGSAQAEFGSAFARFPRETGSLNLVAHLVGILKMLFLAVG